MTQNDAVEELRQWYVAGCSGAVDWAQPDALQKAVAIASPFIEDAESYCRLRQIEATRESGSTEIVAKELPEIESLAKSELLVRLFSELEDERAAKSREQMDDLARLVAKQLLPDIERMEKARTRLIQAEFLDAITKAKQPEINVYPTFTAPELRPPDVIVQPPEVHVDATSTHEHHVAAPEVHIAPPEVHVDATSKHEHNVAAPEVTVNVPKQDAPQVDVHVPPTQPARSKISRDDDGNIVIERQ